MAGMKPDDLERVTSLLHEEKELATFVGAGLGDDYTCTVTVGGYGCSLPYAGLRAYAKGRLEAVRDELRGLGVDI